MTIIIIIIIINVLVDIVPVIIIITNKSSDTQKLPPWRTTIWTIIIKVAKPSNTTVSSHSHDARSIAKCSLFRIFDGFNFHGNVFISLLNDATCSVRHDVSKLTTHLVFNIIVFMYNIVLNVKYNFSLSSMSVWNLLHCYVNNGLINKHLILSTM